MRVEYVCTQSWIHGSCTNSIPKYSEISASRTMFVLFFLIPKCYCTFSSPSSWCSQVLPDRPVLPLRPPELPAGHRGGGPAAVRRGSGPSRRGRVPPLLGDNLPPPRAGRQDGAAGRHRQEEAEVARRARRTRVTPGRKVDTNQVVQTCPCSTVRTVHLAEVFCMGLLNK